MSNQNTLFAPAGATKVLVLINGTMFGEPQGVWMSPYCEGANQYNSFMELIMSIDGFYTEHGYLQRTMQPRSFEKNQERSSLKEVEATRYMTDDLFTDNKAEKATFLVQVLFRQNATWQGKIKWIESGEETKFRSTLEMLKLMDEAITKTEDKSGKSKQA